MHKCRIFFVKVFNNKKLVTLSESLQYRQSFLVRFTSSVSTMKVLNVAEKNDAAKNIAALLSRGTSKMREGLSRFNKIYEFHCNLWNQNCEMIMTSVSGHLLSYEFTGTFRKWQGCNPISLFDVPVVKQCVGQSSLEIKKTLEREVKKCNALIIWTDCDREGENIGFEIIQVCRAVKPNISVYRAKFSEITQTSVNRALSNLCEPDKAVSDAVDVRSELDLRIGAAFTRFQTLRLTRVFPRSLTDMLISYGSCQFPTLGFVVERYLAIEKFKSEPYWKLKVTDERDGLSVEFKWARGRLFEKEPCQIFLDMCLESPSATVQNIVVKPKSKWRPLPLDTVELEKQGSRKLRLSAKRVMQIAEKLYSQGFISYPRTETNIFPKELNLTPLVNTQTCNSNWGSFASELLEKGLNPRQGKKSDQAHPPIHPLKHADNLHGEEAKVYEYVVRHFLACLSSNATGNETTVEVDIAGEKFIANGLQILEKNYLNVYIYEKWQDKEIPAYQRGQTFEPKTINMVQEETSPPQLLTEADLIGLMDKYGIGTDATHAEHIDTIKSRQYVGLVDEKHLMPGKLGIGLVMGYDNMGFNMSKPDLRADLEKDLKLICDRQKDPKDVLENQINRYREVFKKTIEQANLIDISLAEYLEERPCDAQPIQINDVHSEVCKCPRCGLDMVLRDRKQGTGKYIGCMGYPDCKNSIWFPETIESVEILNEVCSQCPGNMHMLKFKFVRNAFPLYGTVYTTCVGGCDPSFNEALNIRTARTEPTIADTGYRTMSGESSLSTDTRNLPRPTSTVGSSGQRQNTNRDDVDRGRNARKRFKPDKNESNNNDQIVSSNFSYPTREPRVSNEEQNVRWGNIDDNTIIVCNCQENAIKLTVKKEGPNKGRLFYKCAKSICDFFLWEDGQTRNNVTNNVNVTLDVTTNPGQSTSRSRSSEVKCKCNETAIRRFVVKEGPNKGRPFHVCARTNDRCNFFQWDDNPQIATYPNTKISSNATKRVQKTTGNRGGSGGASRKCGICGRAGHTRRTCPDNAMD